MPPPVFTPRPWYREPWPWILIALPLSVVIASFVTLWLAISRPDQLVVDPVEYQHIEDGLKAQADGVTGDPQPAANAAADDTGDTIPTTEPGDTEAQSRD